MPVLSTEQGRRLMGVIYSPNPANWPRDNAFAQSCAKRDNTTVHFHAHREWQTWRDGKGIEHAPCITECVIYEAKPTDDEWESL
jgi:hypothetical protein